MSDINIFVMALRVFMMIHSTGDHQLRQMKNIQCAFRVVLNDHHECISQGHTVIEEHRMMDFLHRLKSSVGLLILKSSSQAKCSPQGIILYSSYVFSCLTTDAFAGFRLLICLTDSHELFLVVILVLSYLLVSLVPY
jgi:hypothetical protein